MPPIRHTIEEHAMTSLSESRVEGAIRSAEERGMVPFVLVLPVSREILRDAAGPAAQIAGQMASDAIVKQVRDWQADEGL